MTFVAYDPAVHGTNALVSAIFAGSSGVTLVPGSVAVSYGTQSETGVTETSLSFYDGSIASLNIGAGLLLTSGDATPPATNDESGYSVSLEGDAGTDAQLQATVLAAFPGAGEVQDLTSLQFQLHVTDPAATGLRFDVVFGSDEYPEFQESLFVDVAGVYVNGVNYALFNGSAAQPLSVVKANIDAGNFRDNDTAFSGGAPNLPIEYDGVTIRLQVTAPLQQGTNTIKIAIGDTGDEILDSGIFVSGLQAVNYAGYGLAQQVPVSGGSTVTDTGGNQVYQGDSLGNLIMLVSGQDVVDGGAGIDKVQYQFGVGGVTGYSWDGNVLSLHSGANASTLVNVERVQLGDGSLFALDTGVGEHTYNVYALLHAAFGTPDAARLSDWLADADMAAPGQDLGDLAQAMINAYAGGASNDAVVAYLFQSIVGRAATQQEVQTYTGMIGSSFETAGDLFAHAALLSLNTDKIAGIVGSIQQLDPAHYV